LGGKLPRSLCPTEPGFSPLLKFRFTVWPQTARMADIVRGEERFLDRVLAVLREGAWLDRSRLSVYPWILLGAYLLAAALYIGTSHGLIDSNGKPLGPDYIDVYAASQMAQAGHPAAIYDWSRHRAAESAVFGGRNIPYYGWHYPPFFLLIALPLAALPYGWSLLAYLAATFAGYAATLWRIVKHDRNGMLLAIAFPGVFSNSLHGQNGFLTVTLLGMGLLWMEDLPWIAGVALGLLVYKPQFAGLALLMPLVTGRWRVVASAVVTIAVLALATVALFGIETWQAFIASTSLTRTIVLEQGSTGWERIQSVFSAVRMLGGGIGFAYAAQIVVAVAAVVGSIWAWRKDLPFELRAAILCLATTLITPYLLDYDLVLLALPIAWLVLDGRAHGFLPWEKTMLFALWLLPLVSRGAGSALHIPLGAPVLLLGFGIAIRRAYATNRIEEMT